MKSSVDCYGVTVDNSAVTGSKHSNGAGCYGVSMICTPMHTHRRVRVRAQEFIVTIETS